jgi:hypothetical protein
VDDPNASRTTWRARSLSWNASVMSAGSLKFSMKRSAILCCGLPFPGFAAWVQLDVRLARIVVADAVQVVEADRA